eukprot:TRINITY_DN68882_c0_g1_i1.p1 TRINITY_DN68882_c0_g1~~TRINITY_DN68882_c0_g1_i1.p1  ORF type:complete len:427 (+),score=37.45 TRINITY_DN68882_c0_g1_i1:31-1281(+)
MELGTVQKSYASYVSCTTDISSVPPRQEDESGQMFDWLFWGNVDNSVYHEWTQTRSWKSVQVRKILQEHVCKGQHGLFCTSPVKAGLTLGEYAGQVRAPGYQNTSSQYLADLATCNGTLCIDAETCGNEARFINDYSSIADGPTVKLQSQYNAQTGYYGVGVVCEQDLIPGEEILLSYGTSFWKVHLDASTSSCNDINPPNSALNTSDTDNDSATSSGCNSIEAEDVWKTQNIQHVSSNVYDYSSVTLSTMFAIHRRPQQEQLHDWTGFVRVVWYEPLQGFVLVTKTALKKGQALGPYSGIVKELSTMGDPMGEADSPVGRVVVMQSSEQNKKRPDLVVTNCLNESQYILPMPIKAHCNVICKLDWSYNGMPFVSVCTTKDVQVGTLLAAYFEAREIGLQGESEVHEHMVHIAHQT